MAVAGGKAYILGHRNKDEHLTAIDEAIGKPLWSVLLGPSQKEYDAMRWLYQRTRLVDGDKLIYVPGGASATVIALNKRSDPLPAVQSGRAVAATTRAAAGRCARGLPCIRDPRQLGGQGGQNPGERG